MKISIGTAAILGIKKIKMDILPTTAYIMLGEGCNNNCSFCIQGKNNKKNNYLSRISWIKIDKDTFLHKLEESKIKRVCLQIVGKTDEKILIDLIKNIKKRDISISINKDIRKKEEILKYLKNGVDRIGIGLDAVGERVYANTKKGNFYERLDFILGLKNNIQKKISVHIIIGLGEREKEVIEFLFKLKESEINTSLFAFTPIKGTKMENKLPPDIGYYRRIQIARFIINKNLIKKEDFIFKGEQLIKVKKDNFFRSLENGEAFETSGCSNCNRPYYNERPGGTIYNYGRKLNNEEIEKAIKISGLI